MRQGVFFACCFLAVGSWIRPAAAQVFTSGPASESATQDAREPASVSRDELVEIISFNGSVNVKRGGASEAEPVEEGMLLSSGDTVTTGAGSFVELGFDEEDKNVVRVEEKSTSVILLRDDQKIELLEGEVFSVIRNLPAGRAFEVVTPTAVAGARGTEWVTRYANEETEVEAYDDEPFVRMIDEKGRAKEEIRVTPGFATRVARFAPPTTLARIPVARQQRWQSMRQSIQQRVQGVRERRGRPDRAAFAPGAKGMRLKEGPGNVKPRPDGVNPAPESLRSMERRGVPDGPEGRKSLQKKEVSGPGRAEKKEGDVRSERDPKADRAEGIRAEGPKDDASDKKPQDQVRSSDKKGPAAGNKVPARGQAPAVKGVPIQKNVLRPAGGGLRRTGMK